MNRIVIMTNPDDEGTFQYQMRFKLPSGREVSKLGKYPGPLPTGTPQQIRQQLRTELETAWTDWRNSLKDFTFKGATWDDSGNWQVP